MRRKVVIILDDVVVALDLAQTLQDLDPNADVVTYRTSEAAQEALMGREKVSLAVWQVRHDLPAENGADLADCDLAERCILLSDTAETVYDAAPNIVVLPRPFSDEMVATAVSTLGADH